MTYDDLFMDVERWDAIDFDDPRTNELLQAVIRADDAYDEKLYDIDFAVSIGETAAVIRNLNKHLTFLNKISKHARKALVSELVS